jgi:hypothetical protein
MHLAGAKLAKKSHTTNFFADYFTISR